MSRRTNPQSSGSNQNQRSGGFTHDTLSTAPSGSRSAKLTRSLSASKDKDPPTPSFKPQSHSLGQDLTKQPELLAGLLNNTRSTGTRPLSSGITSHAPRPLGGSVTPRSTRGPGHMPPASPRFSYHNEASASSSASGSGQQTPTASPPTVRRNRVPSVSDYMTPSQLNEIKALDDSIAKHLNRRPQPTERAAPVDNVTALRLKIDSPKSTSDSPKKPETPKELNALQVSPPTDSPKQGASTPKTNTAEFESALPKRKPLKEMSREELMAHVVQIEDQCNLLLQEKEALSGTVAELIGVVSELTTEKQNLTTTSESLQIEREVLVKQLNDVLVVAGEGPALKKANDSLKKQLHRQQEGHSETITMMENKLQSMQEHVERCTSQLGKAEEQVKQLKTENESLQETLDGTVQKLTSYAHKEHKFSQQHELIKALEFENPRLAVTMLAHGKEHYVFACKSLDSKRELLKEALASGLPDVIQYVTAYLNFTLNEALFDSIVMTNYEASSIYLQYLKSKDPQDYARVCFKHGKIKEYAAYQLDQALLVINQDSRAKKLEEVLEYCKQNQKEVGHFLPVIQDHLIDAKLKPIF